jgi:hypothetical protein
MAKHAGEFDGLAAPARRALAGAGYKTLADVAGASESKLAQLHGMGPNALRILREKLARRGLALTP